VTSVESNEAAIEPTRTGVKRTANAADLPSSSAAGGIIDNGKYQTLCSC